MTDVKQLGHFIRETRLKRGLTQQQLADRVGVNASTITRYEQGKFTEVKWAVVREIFHALDASDLLFSVVPEYLHVKAHNMQFDYSNYSTFANEFQSLENTEQIIINKTFYLNEEGRKKVLEYVTDLIDSGKYKTYDIKSEEPKLESEK